MPQGIYRRPKPAATHVIRVDKEVIEALGKIRVGFEKPNDALRRLLKLKERG